MKKNKNIRITIFIGSLRGGGSERVVCNLANYLERNGWNIYILTMSDVKASYLLNSNIQVHPLIFQHERKNFFYNSVVRYLRLKKYIKTENTDCFIVMLPVTTLLLLFLRKKIGGKVIVSERAYPAKYSIIVQNLLKRLVDRADGFVFQTDDSYSWYKPYISEKKTVIIPNAVSEEFLVCERHAVREKRIIAVGRLIVRKNFGLLIKAYSQIAEKYPDYTVAIFGEGPEKSALEDLITELNLENKVVIHSYTKEIKEELQKSKLFVLSSDYEGMPNVLIEAMALGLPCVSTDCPAGGSRFLIQHGINGYLTEVGNVDQMAYYMDLILSSEELADSMGSKAHEIVKRLDPDQIYSAWECFVESILCG